MAWKGIVRQMLNIGNKADVAEKESVDQIADSIIKKLGVKGCTIVICDGAGNCTTTHKGLTICEAVMGLSDAIKEVYDDSVEIINNINTRKN